MVNKDVYIYLLTLVLNCSLNFKTPFNVKSKAPLQCGVELYYWALWSDTVVMLIVGLMWRGCCDIHSVCVCDCRWSFGHSAARWVQRVKSVAVIPPRSRRL